MSGDTSVPGPGEKLCPFCAEVIKEAAIRCRWCRSDLAEAPEPSPEPAEPSAEPSAESSDGPSDAASPGVGRTRRPRSAARGRRTSWLLPALLLALVVVLAFVLVRVVWLQRSDEAAIDGVVRSGSGRDAVSEAARARIAERDVDRMVVSSEGAKTAGMTAAAAALEKVLSYSHQSLDQDVAAGERQLSGRQRREYLDTMKDIRRRTLDDEATVEATVVASSVITATDHDVKALLFVNQVTTGKQLQQPRVDQNRVLVTLHRGSGEWRVTNLTAL